MNSAMPIATGVARTSERAAASSVPKTSGPTKDTSDAPSGNHATSSPSTSSPALSGGHASRTRKIATAASTPRMRPPAPVAVQRNTRLRPRSVVRARRRGAAARGASPRSRPGAGPGVVGEFVVVTRAPGGGAAVRRHASRVGAAGAAGPAAPGVRGSSADGADGDGLDRGVDVGAQVLRDRRAARGRRGGRLALLAREVGEERLDEVARRLVLVARAGDRVR